MAKRSCLAFGLATALMTALPAAAQESTTYQINPAHTGSAFFPGGLKLPLVQRLAFTFPGNIGTPLVAEGKLFAEAPGPTGSQGIYLGAIDLATGGVDWRRNVHGGQITYDQGKVFEAALNPGALRAYDAASGALLWQVTTTDPIEYETPIVAKGGIIFVVFPSENATHLSAIRESDGNTLWSVYSNEWRTPTLTEDGVVVSNGCSVSEYDVVGGPERWVVDAPPPCHPAGATPAYYDQVVLNSRNNGQITETAQRIIDGSLLYTTDNVGNLGASMRGLGESYPAAVQSGIAYYLSDTALQARNAMDNRPLWSVATDGTDATQPVVVNGTVLFVTATGQLQALDGTSGRTVQTIMLPQHTGVATPLLQTIAAGEGKIAVPYYNTLSVFVGSP